MSDKQETAAAAEVPHLLNCGYPRQASTACPGCLAEGRKAWGIRVTPDELRFLLGLAEYAPGAFVCQDRDDDGNCGGNCGTHGLLADLKARCERGVTRQTTHPGCSERDKK